MRRSPSILIALLFNALVAAQSDSVALRFANTISSNELREHLTVIASDAYLGRDTGKEGQKMAAVYLKEAFMKAGIPPVPAPDPSAIVDGYFQPFDVIEERSGTISLLHNGRLVYGKELIYFQENAIPDRDLVELTVVPGKANLDATALRGKDLVIDTRDMGKGAAIIGPLRERTELLFRDGAVLVLALVDDLQGLLTQLHLRDSQMRLADQEKKGATKAGHSQWILIDRKAAESILAPKVLASSLKKKHLSTIPVDLGVRVSISEQRLTTENVLAYIEGTDKKDELVVLTAHYDHVGVKDGVVYNGADDDGTGTVAMIEIAEAFAQAKAAGKGPRRSVLVMPVSGEEKGLLGSRYYSEHPVFPLANTVVDLNIDMIGRRDSVHATSAPYIYVIGSDRLSSGLHLANEHANSTYTKLDLDYTFNAESDPN
ncbi:MAG TPA: M28 family peptidase, partial [Flavobacteriales bacterium]|nr:M28 family peptidase [Flavobacteriales bacterium]